jgi:hypothetical protein
MKQTMTAASSVGSGGGFGAEVQAGVGGGGGGGSKGGGGTKSGVLKGTAGNSVGSRGKRVTAYTSQQWMWMRDRIISERCPPYKGIP